MTVPTFFNLDYGMGSASKPIAPFRVITARIAPLFIAEDAPGSGGGTVPTSGQLWPRRA